MFFDTQDFFAANRHIVHLDGDCFGVAVELRQQPQLARLGQPIVLGLDVGGQGRVAAACPRARHLGIRIGMLLNLARRRAPMLRVLPPRTTLIEEASQEVLEYLSRQCPVVECEATDGFFLDVTGCERLYGGDIARWTAQLCRALHLHTQLPFSAGIATNKLVARLAARAGKFGRLTIVPPGCEQGWMHLIPVYRLPGVGNAIRRRLQDFGLKTAGQVAALGEEALQDLFGRAGHGMALAARGQCSEPIIPTALHHWLSHSIRMLGDTNDPARVETTAMQLLQRLTSDLRRLGLRTDHAELILIYGDGAEGRRTMRIPYSSNQDHDLCEPLRQTLQLLWTRRVRVRALTLRCALGQQSDTQDSPTLAHQSDLFEEDTQQRRHRLYNALDTVRARHGFKSLGSASGVPTAEPADTSHDK